MQYYRYSLYTWYNLLEYEVTVNAESEIYMILHEFM